MTLIEKTMALLVLESVYITDSFLFSFNQDVVDGGYLLSFKSKYLHPREIG